MNYFVQSLYKLGNGEHYLDYDYMQKLSQISYHKNLKGKWEYVLLTGEVINHHDMFFDVFKKLKKMSEDGHNVLFADIDTLCVDQVDIFGKYQDFALFWYAPSGDVSCGVRYMPATMSPKTWRLGLDRWEQYMKHEMQYHEWDREQKIYYEMYRQNPNKLKNKYHYIDGGDNDIYREDACIVHLPATLGPRETMERMKRYYDEDTKKREEALCAI